MVGVGSGPLSDRNASLLAATRPGSVILLGNSTRGRPATRRVTAQVRAATSAPKGLETMLTVDQEGGRVQRLRGPGFDRIPSALAQSRLSDATLRSDAERWAGQLLKAGVDANLAPVADVVPRGMASVNQPIGVLDRGYGSQPTVVADKARAFVAGMDRAGVAAAVKHFPGLGRVRENTDYTARVVDSSTTRHDHALTGFRAGIRAKADMVMVSSAIYRRIDPDHPAAFSRVVIEELLRGDLRFRGVVISDDLSAGAFRELSPGRRALRFFNAGGDLVIVGNPRQAAAMSTAINARAESNEEFAAQVTSKAIRVVTMKARRGMADCD